MNQVTEYLDRYVDRAIYVWGGQGENVCQMKDSSGAINPEAWIKSKDTSVANANRVITLYRARVADGINPVYGFDCSGLVVEMLRSFGLITYDMTASALYTMCDKKNLSASELRVGDFCCYSKDGTAPNISHIGVYVGNDRVIEAYGRDKGVVRTIFSTRVERPWNMLARFTKLEPFTKEIPVTPALFDVTKPIHVGVEYSVMQTALNLAHYTDNNGNTLTVDGKWGAKSRAAFDKMIRLNRCGATYKLTVTEDDVTILEEEWDGI